MASRVSGGDCGIAFDIHKSRERFQEKLAALQQVLSKKKRESRSASTSPPPNAAASSMTNCNSSNGRGSSIPQQQHGTARPLNSESLEREHTYSLRSMSPAICIPAEGRSESHRSMDEASQRQQHQYPVLHYFADEERTYAQQPAAWRAASSSMKSCGRESSVAQLYGREPSPPPVVINPRAIDEADDELTFQPHEVNHRRCIVGPRHSHDTTTNVSRGVPAETQTITKQQVVTRHENECIQTSPTHEYTTRVSMGKRPEAPLSRCDAQVQASLPPDQRSSTDAPTGGAPLFTLTRPGTVQRMEDFPQPRARDEVTHVMPPHPMTTQPILTTRLVSPQPVMQTFAARPQVTRSVSPQARVSRSVSSARSTTHERGIQDPQRDEALKRLAARKLEAEAKHQMRLLQTKQAKPIRKSNDGLVRVSQRKPVGGVELGSRAASQEGSVYRQVLQEEGNNIRHDSRTLGVRQPSKQRSPSAPSAERLADMYESRSSRSRLRTGSQENSRRVVASHALSKLIAPQARHHPQDNQQYHSEHNATTTESDRWLSPPPNESRHLHMDPVPPQRDSQSRSRNDLSHSAAIKLPSPPQHRSEKKELSLPRGGNTHVQSPVQRSSSQKYRDPYSVDREDGPAYLSPESLREHNLIFGGRRDKSQIQQGGTIIATGAAETASMNTACSTIRVDQQPHVPSRSTFEYDHNVNLPTKSRFTLRQLFAPSHSDTTNSAVPAAAWPQSTHNTRVVSPLATAMTGPTISEDAEAGAMLARIKQMKQLMTSMN